MLVHAGFGVGIDSSFVSQNSEKDAQFSATNQGLAYQAFVENLRSNQFPTGFENVIENGNDPLKQGRSTVSTKSGIASQVFEGCDSPSLEDRDLAVSADGPLSSRLHCVVESNSSSSDGRRVQDEVRRIQHLDSDTGTLSSFPKGVGKSIERKRVNNAHTRLCRKRVNDKFQELLNVLPPVDNSEHLLRHKSQILDYCIRKVGDMKARNAELEEKLNAAVTILDMHIKQGGGGDEKLNSCSKTLKSFIDLLHLGKKE